MILPGELHTIEAYEKISDKFKSPLETIQTAQNQKPTNTRDLLKLLMLKMLAKVMLTVNIDMQDCLIKGQTEYVRYIEFAKGKAG